jgi:hypothetical protein
MGAREQDGPKHFGMGREIGSNDPRIAPVSTRRSKWAVAQGLSDPERRKGWVHPACAAEGAMRLETRSSASAPRPRLRSRPNLGIRIQPSREGPAEAARGRVPGPVRAKHFERWESPIECRIARARAPIKYSLSSKKPARCEPKSESAPLFPVVGRPRSPPTACTRGPRHRARARRGPAASRSERRSQRVQTLLGRLVRVSSR